MIVATQLLSLAAMFFALLAVSLMVAALFRPGWGIFIAGAAFGAASVLCVGIAAALHSRIHVIA